jgi:hypothetical protein
VKEEEGTRTENPSRKGSGVNKKDIAVFAFFLFLSFLFWYINSLGKEMEAGIKYELKYTNLPRERFIKEGQSSEVSLYLKGPGYTILKLKLSGRKAPLNIDISKVNYKRSAADKNLNYYIVTSALLKSLQVQIRSGCEITSIKPDTLFFTFARVSANSTSLNKANSDQKQKK